MQAFEVRRVRFSEDLSSPGDFVFIGKRQPRITVERLPLEAPAGILEKLWWKFFGKKYEMKQIVEMVWPDYDAIILDCPACNGPCATTKRHKILSIEPLTLEIPLTCPYCKMKSFTITEGRLSHPPIFHCETCG